MTSAPPFSQACENNKAFIFEKLALIAHPGACILEIGSGTAQHARYFAENLPEISWQPAELEENQRVLNAGLAGHNISNLLPPIVLDVRSTWPEGQFDGIFSANCLHIMSAACVERFFAGVAKLIKPRGFLCVYGPFNYGGQFSSESNAKFEQWLKSRDSESGIRDVEWVTELATAAGFDLLEDYEMPANNRLLHWQKRS